MRYQQKEPMVARLLQIGSPADGDASLPTGHVIPACDGAIR